MTTHDQPGATANIDDLLSELSAAERAGVFRNSSIEAAALLSEANRAKSVPAILRLPRWVPFAAAAVLVLTAVTWSTMFSWKLAELREAKVQHRSRQLVVASTSGDAGFFDCLSGPAANLSDHCKPYDFDGDGDVDMSDWAAHQQPSSSARDR